MVTPQQPGQPGLTTPEGSITQPETPSTRQTQELPTMPASGQQTTGQGDQPAHLHPATIHSHDHYHVSHHHKGSFLGEWDHRTYWHTHEHNHAALQHSHDYSRDDEEADHAKEAHVHDHAAPAQPAG